MVIVENGSILYTGYYNMESPLRLSNEDFAYIYSKVPRFNVDLIIRTQEGGIVLIQRSIEPHVGSWHLPGGTLYKEETIKDAVVRVAKHETGFEVEVIGFLGVMEFPAEKRGALSVHTISVGVEVHVLGGTLKQDNNAKNIGVFTTFPSPMVPGHFAFLKEHGILEEN